MSDSFPKIKFSEEASFELEAAALWYEEHRPGLGSDFVLSVEASLNSIRRTPQLYPVVLRNNIRRALIKRFPYGLIFRESGDLIEIVSVFHSRRNPKTLKRRF